jgi:hypothetical protein
VTRTEQEKLAFRIGRDCRSVCARPWSSTCVWCQGHIAPDEERGFVPLVGALHVDCLVAAIAVADAALQKTA